MNGRNLCNFWDGRSPRLMCSARAVGRATPGGPPLCAAHGGKPEPLAVEITGPTEREDEAGLARHPTGECPVLGTCDQECRGCVCQRLFRGERYTPPPPPELDPPPPGLRDQLAAAALTGLIAAGAMHHDPRMIAHSAYTYADAMLEMRRPGTDRPERPRPPPTSIPGPGRPRTP